ncbi:hypothetical protein BpHYR1_040960 [Brachionus plicatilis]|uniref:Uncharacterized protein n=1 Tax=Brachionus plicatilis TaxID=10195 RepID=A0A3M7T4F3_BRAPC|nr:hypothetical protein BpHYR1_040960 [Brachionus plicatilis]
MDLIKFGFHLGSFVAIKEVLKRITEKSAENPQRNFRFPHFIFRYLATTKKALNFFLIYN